MAVYIAGAMALVPVNAWGAELSSNYHQRSRVAGSSVVFGLGGSMLTLLLIDTSSNEALQSSLTAIALLVIAGLSVTVPVACHFVPDDSMATRKAKNLRNVLRLLTEPSPFRRLLFVYFLCSAVSVPVWVRVAGRFGKHQT